MALLSPASYLLLRHSRFYFRCCIPAGLLAAVPQRRELVRTLQTGDPTLARLRASIMALCLPRLWIRLGMAGTADELDRLVDEWFEREVERQWRLFASGDFARALFPPEADEDEQHALNRHWVAAHAEREIERLADDYAHGRFGSGKPEARAIAAGLTTPLAEDSQRFAVLCKQVMEARGAIEEARIRWAEGESNTGPPAPA